MTRPADSSSGAILTINGGSSSIKFAVFSNEDSPRRFLSGEISKIGSAGTQLKWKKDSEQQTQSMDAPDHQTAARHLIELLKSQLGSQIISAVGHRVVHGGANLVAHQPITPEVLAELRRIVPLDLMHLPREIALMEAFTEFFPNRPQIACFDTAFHCAMPTVARMLPIPRKYFEAGVRRFGFHGLSYTYLMRQLGPKEAAGKVVLAHLGSGASMAAVRNGKPIDTTMAFTPTAGLVMGTRPGDLDPGLLVYLARTEKLSADQLDVFISNRCGLLGVSETTSDMQTLLSNRAHDPRAADAVDLFCYQAAKFIGALSTALEGLNTLVFSGGIGEHAAAVRWEICRGLEFLGIRLDQARNDANAPVISQSPSGVTVRVIATAEESIIAEVTRGFVH